VPEKVNCEEQPGLLDFRTGITVTSFTMLFEIFAFAITY